jgi:capsular exopolysaccharide synthesis family protein
VPFPALDPGGHKPGAARSISRAHESAGYTSVEGGWAWFDYVRVLHKRRWMVAAVFAGVVLGTALYTVSATPIYEASTQMLIEKENTNIVNFKEAFEQNQITDDYYQTQYKILRSRAIARRTLGALNLWTTPEPPRARALHVVMPEWMADAVGRATALWRRLSESIEPAAPDETAVESAVIDRFLGALTIAPVRGSRLVDVKFASADPARAANVANALGKAYIQQNLEFKFMASKEASDWLTQRLGEQRQRVEASEQALQRYREQTDAVSLEERQNIVVQKLADLNSAVTRAKTERIQKESAYRQLKSAQSDRTTSDSAPAILSNVFIQQQQSALAELQRQQAQLSEKLGPNHPEMVRLAAAIRTAEAKIQGEVAKVVQAMRNDYQATIAQEASLTAALEQQKREALELNRKGIDYGVLQRDAATNRQIFDSLLQRTKETGISGELKTSNVRIVDLAEVPRQPIAPNTARNLMSAVVWGGVASFALAFFFEAIDNRLKNPEEIRQALGLPFLGMIPTVFEGSGYHLITEAPVSTFAESFRTVRTNVLFSSTEEDGRALLVTSTGPGEGKTLTAANLAIALAQAGQRVLLIDADMRRPCLHETFNVGQEPGLSNVLVADAKASQAIRGMSVQGLWLLPAGLIPPNPAELLGSKRFKDFVRLLRQQFDFVVIDSPPVMAVTDASIVAHIATDVLYVVGADITNRNVARRALEQLEHSRGRLIGGVLNRVDLKNNGYYYSHYYRREYTRYYGSHDAASAREIAG